MPLPSHKKSIASRQADLVGKVFESTFQFMCQRNGMACTRIPDGCKQVAHGKIIRLKSPFDWIVSLSIEKTSRILLCDTKTTAGATFPFSKINQDQVAELRKHEGNGIIAGYVIEFREPKTVYFFPALVLASASGKGSLKPEGIVLGGSAAFDVRRIFPAPHAATDSHFPGRITT